MSPSKWPIHSRGLSVLPNQIPEMKRLFPNHKFDPKTGHMIIGSQKEFEQVRADLGFVDNDGFGTKRISREGHRMAEARIQEEAVKKRQEREQYLSSREGKKELAEMQSRRRKLAERFLEKKRQARRG